MKKIIFNESQTQDIIKKYLNENKALSTIGKELGVSRPVISRILKENNIKLRTKTHKYTCDYDIFENIDNNEKAYWLGFIAADGTVYQREQNASVIISIGRKDREHLEKFKQFCHTDAKIIDFVNTTGFSSPERPCEMTKIVLNSKKMVQDCINKNITPRKSLTMGIPNIPKEFYYSFILGYFDGDGSIFKMKSNSPEYGINIIGSFDFITWVNNLLNMSSHLEKRKEETEIYHIRCGGTNKPYKILKQLYDSCEIHLDRKFKIFQELETVVLNRNIK